MKNKKAIKELVNAYKVWQKAVKIFEGETGIFVIDNYAPGKIHLDSMPSLIQNKKDVIIEHRPNGEYQFEISHKCDGIKLYSIHKSPKIIDNNNYELNEFMNK